MTAITEHPGHVQELGRPQASLLSASNAGSVIYGCNLLPNHQEICALDLVGMCNQNSQECCVGQGRQSCLPLVLEAIM